MIAVETVANNNIISYLKNNLPQFDINLENVQFFTFSPLFFLKG